MTGDPTKLKENLLGFDGHSLRAYSFFQEELEAAGLGDLDPDDPKSINRIKTEAPDLRQDAKPIGFLKQYGGGVGKIQKVLKCSRARAVEVSDAYDELYRVTVQFTEKNRQFASRNGFIEGAFGLRLKTPRINSSDDEVASSEARSSSNMKTQAYGMLTNRAGKEFRDRILVSPYADDVFVANQIHDAIYLIWRDSPEVTHWVNINLVEAMEWQELPELQSEIRLGAELDVGVSWDKQYTLPNNATLEEVVKFMDEKVHADV